MVQMPKNGTNAEKWRKCRKMAQMPKSGTNAKKLYTFHPGQYLFFGNNLTAGLCLQDIFSYQLFDMRNSVHIGLQDFKKNIITFRQLILVSFKTSSQWLFYWMSEVESKL